MTPVYHLLEISFRMVSAYTKNRTVGVENLPPRGQGYVAAANHKSFADAAILPQTLVTARKEPIHMVSYSELFDIPVMGSILRSAQGLVLDRGSQEGIERFMRDAKYVLLERGEGVGVHPEAHIQRGPHLGRGRPGAAQLSIETGCPVVPIGLFGTDVVMPPGTTRLNFKRRAMSIVIGEPIRFDRYRKAYEKACREADARTRKTILDGCTTVIMRAIGRITRQRYPFGERALGKLGEFEETRGTGGPPGTVS